MSKKRITPFKEEHALEYGLEIASRSASKKEVDSVRCKFCIWFGKEGSVPERKRKITENTKYFTKPFRVDNYKSHLKTHKLKWAEYQALSKEEKRAFFDLEPEKYVNTLPAHYDIERKENLFCFDADIVETLIGGMLFDLDDEEERMTKERALSIFKLSEDNDKMYTVTIKNMKQFSLAIKYISLGSSFRLTTRIFQVTKEETNIGYLGSISVLKVINYVRILLAISLQTMKDLLTKSWCYSAAFDGSTYQHTSYLDIRVRIYFNGDIKNIHVIALPMFDRHTGDYMYELFENLFNVLDPSWKTKLIGVTTDGAANMTGRHRGVVTKIQGEALPEGFYRVWCALHQLDIVVQKCVTKYFSDDFYGGLTGLIGYLRRQQNLIQRMKTKCPKVADTRWLSLGKVCKWFCKHKSDIKEYLDEKNPVCKPPSQWWLYVAACETVIKEVNVAFVAGQGLTTLVGEQQKSLDKLKRNLLEVLGGRRVIYEEHDDEVNYIQGGFVVKRADAIGMIKDCGLYYQSLFDEVPCSVQKGVWRDVSKFVISIVIGIEQIEEQNDTSSGYKVPPVLPSELVQLRSYEFNEIVAQQARRFLCFKTQAELESLQEQHRELISAFRSEEPLRDAIQSSKDCSSFEEGWKCIGSGRFEELKEFCGSLATVFPGTSTVESDFSVVNYEKNDNRTALTDLSLEGILHSKQYKTIQSFSKDL